MLIPAAPGRADDVRLPVFHMQRWWSRSWRERLVAAPGDEDETCATISLSPCPSPARRLSAPLPGEGEWKGPACC
ncbi:hypothetical protein XELAEV_18016270mg [Xenopus laevis]|uniref:Uncharacterized protein n=1 Tax=Xenopus laevis TaxID=8355 RepID=A0A974DKQ2_XENLA|nr:hypothetical protein XELAEV_18016270mg [Xenopus laevis]